MNQDLEPIQSPNALIVTLILDKASNSSAVGGWTNGEQARVVEYRSETEIVVELLNPELARDYEQPLARQLGYPKGFLVVTPNNIQKNL